MDGIDSREVKHFINYVTMLSYDFLAFIEREEGRDDNQLQLSMYAI